MSGKDAERRKVCEVVASRAAVDFFLINTARGNLVDEALYDALRCGEIAGAGSTPGAPNR